MFQILLKKNHEIIDLGQIDNLFRVLIKKINNTKNLLHSELKSKKKFNTHYRNFNNKFKKILN
jgi:hypothetical protein